MSKLQSIQNLLVGALLILFIILIELQFNFEHFDDIWGSGDSLFFYALTAQRTQYQFDSQRFGFPGGMDLSTFPILDSFNWLLQLFYSLLTNNPFVIVNLTFITLIFLNFCLAHFLAQFFIKDQLFHFLFSINIILLPWAFNRFEHLTLIFFMTALTPLMLIKERLKDPKLSQIAFFGILLGAQSAYLVFFALLVVFLISVLQRMKHLKELVTYFLATGLSFTVNLYVTSGGNFSVADSFQRVSYDSFLYGGDPFIWILPLPFLLWFKFSYYEEWARNLGPLKSELNEAVGYSNFGNFSVTIAFIISILIIVDRVIKRLPLGVLETKFISIITLLFFFYTKGGLGLLFSIIIDPQLRSWNRLAPLMQALVLLLCIILIERNFQSLPLNRQRFVISAVVLVSIMSLGNLTGSDFFRERVATSQYAQAAEKITQLVPQRCGILQLPDQAFPEGRPLGKMGSYGHFAISISDPGHSYSFGAVKGLESPLITLDSLQKFDGKSLDRTYCAVLLDRRGDVSKQLEEGLDKIFSQKNVISPHFVIYKFA